MQVLDMQLITLQANNCYLKSIKWPPVMGKHEIRQK